MKRRKFDPVLSRTRLRLLQILMGAVFVYFLLMSFEIIPYVLRTGSDSGEDGPFEPLSDSVPRAFLLESEEKGAPSRPADDPLRDSRGSPYQTPKRRMREFKRVSGLVFEERPFDGNVSKEDQVYELHKSARDAWRVGKKLWGELESGKIELNESGNRSEPCPHSFSLSGSEFQARNRVLVIPCGLTLWSHLTVVGTPRWAHPEYDPKIAVLKDGDEAVMVSQFMMELQGLKTVDGEDPPRILHFNPRLKGDWSGKPVIEHNTCYRMQWGSALRCEGWPSRADEDTGRSLSCNCSPFMNLGIELFFIFVFLFFCFVLVSFNYN